MSFGLAKLNATDELGIENAGKRNQTDKIYTPNKPIC